jgi:hypothetical protein
MRSLLFLLSVLLLKRYKAALEAREGALNEPDEEARTAHPAHESQPHCFVCMQAAALPLFPPGAVVREACCGRAHAGYGAGAAAFDLRLPGVRMGASGR